ncbi:hypothetical protein MUK42_33296 [Musa troglodytarum]|uniref:Uncharacterized protein n=1 Tax=Musa troglodytarum TaxID=320322 RepID=A0A9E7JN79_9LILI|nr:hypothetical protein MUK42_33296 [Musa troglodytarum]
MTDFPLIFFVAILIVMDYGLLQLNKWRRREFDKRGEYYGREEARSSSSHFAANRWKRMDQKNPNNPHSPSTPSSYLLHSRIMK